MLRYLLSTALFFVCGRAQSYTDIDQVCKQGRFADFRRAPPGAFQRVQVQCQEFEPVDKPILNQRCRLMQEPFQCDLRKREGCSGPNEWLGGFQVFETGSNAEIYIPYCCTADNVFVYEPDPNSRRGFPCRKVLLNKNGRAIRHSVDRSLVMKYVTCHSIEAKYPTGRTEIFDQIFFAWECPYEVHDLEEEFFGNKRRKK